MDILTTDRQVLNWLKDRAFHAPAPYAVNPIGEVKQLDVCTYLRYFQDNSVDFIFTDEPYGVSGLNISGSDIDAEYQGYSSEFEWDKLKGIPPPFLDLTIDSPYEPRLPMHLQNEWVFEAARVLKPGGRLINFGMVEFTATFRDVCKVAGLTWRASGPIIKTNVAPHLRKNNFKSGHEHFFFASKGPTKGNIEFLEQTEMRNYQLEQECPLCRTVFPIVLSNMFIEPYWFDEVQWAEIGTVNTRKLTNHPTEKPVWLVDKFLKICSTEESLVVDPFCGGGNLIYEAARMGRKWAGNDLSLEWSSYARERMNELRHKLSEQEGLAQALPEKPEG